MGLVTSFRGGSETRPAGPDAGLRGARCPGRGKSVGAAMKRGTGLSQGRKVLARAAVERRKASAPPNRPPQGGGKKRKARAANPPSGNAAIARSGLWYAPFGAQPPLLGGPFVKTFGKPRGANKKRSARTGELVIASQRTRAKSRGPMTGSAKQSRAAGDNWEARWIASSRSLSSGRPLGRTRWLLAMTKEHLAPRAGRGRAEQG